MTEQTVPPCKAVYLTADDLRVAASILYNAYHQDPFFLDALKAGQQVQYEQKLRGAIREELNELWQQEQTLIGLFVEDRLIGLACIVTQQFALGQDREWHWRLKMLLSSGWPSMRALMNKEHKILQNLPSSDCGILEFIAVSPVEQHKGYGHTLVQAVLSWCDEQPELEGIGLFVTQPAHIAFFNKHGFENKAHLTLDHTEGELLFYASSNG